MPSLPANSEKDDGDTSNDPPKDDATAWLSYTAYPASGDAVSGSAAASSHEVESAQKSKKHSSQQKKLTPESYQKSESFPDPYPEESKLIEFLNSPKPPRKRVIDDPTPISMMNRTNIRRLFRMKEFSNAQSSALGYGLRNIRRDSWAKAFEGYPQRLALAITSEENSSGCRLCRCFYKRLCGLTDFCPRQRVMIRKEALNVIAPVSPPW